jgi:3-hydroxyacyl-CoA dehydrogenase / enoyl-CoA hydratase / 3-hydroxybutyryl-CoA epimerase
MTFTHFQLETDPGGILIATWAMEGRSMNVITQEVMTEVDHLIDHVVNDPSVKGCVITSGKDSFSGGADLSMLEGLSKSYESLVAEQGEDAAMEEFFAEASRLSRLYRKLETCGKPFAIAIHGICLGGAFEWALACHYRVLSDDASTRVGLPEVKVGLFPGAGGTQRVARLMPTGDALQMLFKGEHLRSHAARSMNLVNAVVPRDQMVQAAKDWILQGGSATAPWDDKAFKLPSNKVYSAAGMQIWPAANGIYRRETMGNYPAARAILSSVYEGLQLPMDLGLRVESRYFAKILRSKEAASMIRTLFLSMQDLGKGARRPKDIPPSDLKTIGIIGAGFMGASIAYVTAQAGLNVVLIDRDLELAEKGRMLSHKLITGQIAKGRAKTADRDALLARITPAIDHAALKDCDLIIEAVFEDPAIKAETIAKATAEMREDTIFASNTSTLPITDLATHTNKPHDFIGIHFFSPVEKMMLVEIIMGKQTSAKALATAMDYVRLIKKTPIVVNDSRGFYANRCVLNYVREGHLMLLEGVPPSMIEAAGRMAGMPVGPLALNDEVALDLAYRIVKATEQANQASVNPAQKKLLHDLVEIHGRLGRKNGKGFYDYPENGPKRLWPELASLVGNRLNPDTIDLEELKTRLLVTQALEAAKTFEEGVVTDPREADVGSILGFGFAPFTGGTLSMIDGMGVKAFIETCQNLEAKFGVRFKPSTKLINMEAEGRGFYSAKKLY